MRRFIIAILAVMAVSVGISAQNDSRATGRKMRVTGVAFYNLENLFDTINNNGKYDLEFSPAGARQWDGRKYWLKINNLARAISEMKTRHTPLGPAIIGVSEIENRSVLMDLVKADAIKDWDLKVVHHDSPDRRGVDVGLLYNPKLFKVLGVSNHTLRIADQPDFRTRDQMCVLGLLGGQKVAVIVNHWPSRLGGAERSSYLREAAASLSKEIADSLWRIDPNTGVIIMGDLNDDPFDKSCAKVLNARKEKKEVAAPHGFYNPFWGILDKGIGSLAYKGGWNLFDQIIISGNLLGNPANPHALKFSDAKVLNFNFLRDTEGNRRGYPLRTYSAGAFLGGYSDHFPTEIFFIQEVR